MIGYEIVMSNQGAIHDREQKLPNTKTSGKFYVESYFAPLWMSRNICLLDQGRKWSLIVWAWKE
jgi:hypothetical protein